MAGGTWTDQNKLQPGVYIDFASQNANAATPGTRGVVTMALPLSWGAEGQVITLNNGDDTMPTLGYPITDAGVLPVQQVFLGSSQSAPPVTLLLWRLATTGAAQATLTANGLTITALYNGVRGNDISVAVAADPDNVGQFIVSTFVDGVAVDAQDNKGTIGELAANGWVSFSGTASTVLTAMVGTSLASGADGTIANGAFAAYLDAIQVYTFNVIGYPGTELYGPLAATSITSAGSTATVTTAAAHGLCSGTVVTIAGASPAAYNGTHTITVTGTTTFTYTFAGGASPASGVISYDPTAFMVGANQSVFIEYVLQWANDDGRYTSGVLGAIKDGSGNDTTAMGADSEFIISVNNGVILSDGTVLSAGQCVPWVAGTTAGANYNQSLTYATYPGTTDCNPRLNSSQINTAIGQGSFTFQLSDGGVAQVIYDIDTFTSFTPTKGQIFSKNRPMRTMEQIANDIRSIWSEYFVGKVNNDAQGRTLYKGQLVGYLQTLQGNHAIQNFSADDVTVSAGVASDAAVVGLNLQLVDSIDKVYLSVTVC